MAITEAQWHESLMENKAKQKAEREIHFGLMRQAVVDAQYLTGREEWDKYLRMLQAELDGSHQELAHAQSQLTAPLSSDALRLLYVKINVMAERIKILDWCMKIPKQICEGSAKVPA
jgi:hypothetical protein